jgi:hypothetical protein
MDLGVYIHILQNNLASQADWTGLLGLIESSRNKQNTATPDAPLQKVDLSVKVRP